MPPGSYSFKAIAYDNKGASTTSSTITVTVTGSTGSYPTKVTFTPSVDDSVVTNYRVRGVCEHGKPEYGGPIATRNLGKPVPSGGTDTADVGATIGALAPGNYIATVSAVGVGGSSRSTAAHVHALEPCEPCAVCHVDRHAAQGQALHRAWNTRSWRLDDAHGRGVHLAVHVVILHADFFARLDHIGDHQLLVLGSLFGRLV